MGRLKPIIKPFNSGWSYILDLSFKLISRLVIWSYNCKNAVKKNITHLGTSIVWVCQSILNIFPQWIAKPRIKNSRITTNQAEVQEDLHKISVHVRNHNTMYKTVNLGDTIDVTLLSVTGHDISPFLPTFHIMAWWLKKGRELIPNPLLLVDKIECFVLLIIVKILRHVKIQNWNHPFSFQGTHHGQRWFINEIRTW